MAKILGDNGVSTGVFVDVVTRDVMSVETDVVTGVVRVLSRQFSWVLL